MNFAFLNRTLYLAIATIVVATPVVAYGSDTAVHTYALLVGSNEAGPGQAPLNYAQDDALRVADVLITLGHYAPENVERLLGPTSERLRGALDRVARELRKRENAGEQSVFFFYYSGHARADALNFGGDKFALDELRERIIALPSTLSIVVLDACQSGAFSKTKGAAPAADFSDNSVQRLNTEGVVVLASSGANELSQESADLRSSFFTNHLLVALRGAADVDADGQVTLGEVYKYAYNHTLASTAVTTVGEQHVTIETELRGQREVPVTFPAEANAHLRITENFEGKVLLQHTPSLNVIAELVKVAGEPMQLALPPGSYRATIRTNDKILVCGLNLAEGGTRASWRTTRASLRATTASRSSSLALPRRHRVSISSSSKGMTWTSR
jgi:hypothetical protein